MAAPATRGWNTARRLVGLAVMVVAASGGHVAYAETFDFHIRAYCAPTDPYCGFVSEAEYRRYMLEVMQEVNLQWEFVGYSFRPIVFQIEQENKYSQIPGCHGTPAQEAVREEWRDNVAAASPWAITMLVTKGHFQCCAQIPEPGWPEDELYGITCDPKNSVFEAASFLAHELGHYWCLKHPFSLADRADSGPDPPNHDGDGLQDTPPDPAPKEGYSTDNAGNPRPGKDVDATGAYINGHEFCHELILPPFPDDGSPRRRSCGSRCYEVIDGELVTTTEAPSMAYIMNYYSGFCKGPFVVNGQPVHAFTEDARDEIRACRTAYPPRVALQEVCGTRGTDTDFDGICNDDDNCASVRNTAQIDTDGDGAGDACDLCPENPHPTGDMDIDGVGDLCDPDRDGDGCDNGSDQHPDDDSVVVGSRFNSSCGAGREDIYGFEGDDSDGDGVLNCADPDDDDDGICDGAFFMLEGTPGAEDGCSLGPDACPEEVGQISCHAEGILIDCVPPWLVCLGGGCSQFFLKVVSIANPDPVTEVVFDTFEIVNRSFYLAPLPGRTVSQSAMSLTGVTARGIKLTDADGSVLAPDDATRRLEIWSPSPARRVAVVTEFEPSDVIFGEIARGHVLTVTPTTVDGIPVLDVEARHGVGVESSDLLLDSDADGRPDATDNCLLAENFLQLDSDADGFGDACDPDFDNDLVVTADELEAIQQCDGADLTLSWPILEPEWLGGFAQDAPDSEDLALAAACQGADLNGDGMVTRSDLRIAADLENLPPGPSARRSTEPDADLDGVADQLDNCPGTFNPNQGDSDGDGVGDVCDPVDGETDVLFVPAVASSPGLHGTFWSSSLWIHNLVETPVMVLGAVLPSGVDNGSAPDAVAQIATVPASGFVEVRDVVGALGTAGTGGIYLMASTTDVTQAGDLVQITSKTFTPDPEGGGSYGQGIPAVRADDLTHKVVPGAFEGGEFRTNVGVLNTSEETITVTIYVLAGDGARVGQAVWLLPPFGHQQQSITGLGVASLDGGSVSFQMAGSGGSFAAYTSVVDNTSGDAVYTEAR